jgi:hypothetical protein
MRADVADDPAMQELAAARDSGELCRLLLRSSSGSSTRHREAVGLLRDLPSDPTVPNDLVALMLCTYWRWRRVTAKLIAGIEECGVLSHPELDELAESLISDKVIIVYPFSWISERWLEFDTAGGPAQSVEVGDQVTVREERHVEPPLRRWGAARVLRSDPARLEDLLGRAAGLPPRHRDALLHGLLDASDGLDTDQRRLLVSRGMASGVAGVRRAALDRLCELDGLGAAQRRARSDPDRTVRAWRPPEAPAR